MPCSVNAKGGMSLVGTMDDSDIVGTIMASWRAAFPATLKCNLSFPKLVCVRLGERLGPEAGQATKASEGFRYANHRMRLDWRAELWRRLDPHPRRGHQSYA